MGKSTHTVADPATPSRVITARVDLGSRPADDPSPPIWDTPPPPTAGGDYELLGLLGRGGMGTVYLARQKALNRKVAYKVLTHLDLEALERFRGEAETLARLDHPHIVQVFDSGTAHGTPFIAMEYVAGGSVADKVRAGRLAPAEAAGLMAVVSAAVGHAHAQRIIHRDLKPANILLTPDGQPKVADFGLARDVGIGRLTRTGQAVGTPVYMAPEQLTGRKDLTPAADVWALGCVLYELLTRAVPFRGDEPGQILINILRHEAVSPRAWNPNLPRDLETICLKCLHTEPHRRYPTAAELADDLTRFLNHQTIRARPVGPVVKGARWCHRNPLMAGLTAGTAALLVAVTGVSLTLANRASAERTRAVAAAAAEADLRRRAEESAGEEKKARLEAEGLAAMLDSLVASVKSGQGAIDGLRKQLDQTAAALTADTGDPLIRARLLYTVAITRRNIGDYAEAVPLMERSLALRTEHLGGAHPLTRETAGEMGYTYVHVRRGEDAVRVLQPLADAGPAEDSVDALPVLHRLRIAYHAAGRTDEAAALGERILAFCVRHYGEDHEETEWMRLQLPRYTGPDRQFDEALPVLRKAYDKLLGTWGPTAVPFIVARAELGRCLFDAGRPEEALPYLKEMYEATVSRSGPNHPITLSNANDLARAYEACGRPADAIPLRRTLRDHYRAAGDAARADYQAARLAEAEAAVESGR